MNNLSSKKARFEANIQKEQKRKRIVLSVMAAILILGSLGIIISTRESIPGLDSKYSIGRSLDYEGKKIEMTEITPVISNGQVKLALANLEKSSIIYAMYDQNLDIGNGQKGLPLMAYLTPAGRVTVATSFCEPCYSRKFHIDGDVLVCNTCYTRWALADLTGLGGGCVKYPPSELKYTVDKDSGQIIVQESDLKNWKPRDYDASSTEGMQKNS